MSNLISLKEDIIAQQIFFIRSEKVIPDFDLAVLYNVETKIV